MADLPGLSEDGPHVPEIQTDSGCTEERVLVQFNSPNMDHMQQWQQGERTQVADTFAGGFEATQ